MLKEYYSKNDKLMMILRNHYSMEDTFIEKHFGNEADSFPTRTMVIVKILLSSYYKIDSNKGRIDEFLASLESLFSKGYGPVSFAGEYSKKMDELEDMLKEMKLHKV